MPLNPTIIQALRESGQLSDETAGRFPIEPRIVGSTTTPSFEQPIVDSVQSEEVIDQPDQAVELVDYSSQAIEPVDSGAQGLQGVSYSPGMGNYDEAFRIQQEGLAKSYGAQAKQATAEAAYQNEVFKESERQRNAALQKESEENAMLDEKFSALNQKMDEYAKSPKTLSQQFAKASTGQKIISGIALFLGAAPNSAGQNKAMMAMQAALEDDLRAQEQDVANYKGLYNDLKDTFGDRRQARLAATAAYINNAQLKLQQIASQYKSPQIQGNFEMLYGKLEEEKEKLKNELQMNWLATAAKAREGDEKIRERFVPGMGLALTKEDATKLKEEGATTYSAIDTIKEIKKIAGSGSRLNPNTRNAVKQKIGLLVGALRVPVVGPGAFTDSEREFIGTLVGNPNKIFTLQGLEMNKLTQLEDTLKRSRAAKARAYGMQPQEYKREQQDTPLE